MNKIGVGFWFILSILIISLSACNSRPPVIEENLENQESAQLESVQILEKETDPLDDLEEWDLVWVTDSSGW